MTDKNEQIALRHVLLGGGKFNILKILQSKYILVFFLEYFSAYKKSNLSNELFDKFDLFRHLKTVIYNESFNTCMVVFNRIIIDLRVPRASFLHSHFYFIFF